MCMSLTINYNCRMYNPCDTGLLVNTSQTHSLEWDRHTRVENAYRTVQSVVSSRNLLGHSGCKSLVIMAVERRIQTISRDFRTYAQVL
jgi:hypothetical protein